MLFGAALSNIGRRPLDAMCELAPAPTRARTSTENRPRSRRRRPAGVQGPGNMDPATGTGGVRASRLGAVERGMVLTHAATGRPFATKYAQAMFGQERETARDGLPGGRVRTVKGRSRVPGHPLGGRPGRVPAHPFVRARALRRRAVQGRRESTSSSGGASTSSHTAGRRPGTRPTCADQARRCAVVGPLQYDAALHRPT